MRLASTALFRQQAAAFSAGVYISMETSRMSDTQLIDCMTILSRYGLGKVDMAFHKLLSALQASQTMKARLARHDGWKLLLPLSHELTAAPELLPKLDGWLSPLGADAAPLASILPFALLLALSHQVTTPGQTETAKDVHPVSLKLTRRLATGLENVPKAALVSMSYAALHGVTAEACVYGVSDADGADMGPGPAKAALQTVLTCLAAARSNPPKPVTSARSTNGHTCTAVLARPPYLLPGN